MGYLFGSVSAENPSVFDAGFVDFESAKVLGQNLSVHKVLLSCYKSLSKEIRRLLQQEPGVVVLGLLELENRCLACKKKLKMKQFSGRQKKPVELSDRLALFPVEYSFPVRESIA